MTQEVNLKATTNHLLAIRELVDYLWQPELEHYLQCGRVAQDYHIWNSIETLGHAIGYKPWEKPQQIQ